jgi:hypothetical protein
MLLDLLRNRFFWLLVLLFLIGVVLLSPELVAHVPLGRHINTVIDFFLHGELRPKLGDAIIIASVLAAAVDRYLKLNLLEEASRDALAFAAGHALPAPIKHRIADLIRAPHARRGFRMMLTLTRIKERPGYVRLLSHTSYAMLNLTGDPLPFAVRSVVEQSRWPQAGENKLLLFKLTRERDAPVVLNEDELRARQTVAQDALVYAHDVVLDPADGRPLHVETAREIVAPESWFYALDMLYLTMGVEIVVNSDPEFVWEANFGPEAKPKVRERNWENPGVHLPGQVVRLVWKRR